jgi:hypothetical protein
MNIPNCRLIKHTYIKYLLFSQVASILCKLLRNEEFLFRITLNKVKNFLRHAP